MASGYAATICLAVLMPVMALVHCAEEPAPEPPWVAELNAALQDIMPGYIDGSTDGVTRLDVGAAPPPDKEVSETYLIKEAQQAWAREFVWLFHSIIGDRSLRNIRGGHAQVGSARRDQRRPLVEDRSDVPEWSLGHERRAARLPRREGLARRRGHVQRCQL